MEIERVSTRSHSMENSGRGCGPVVRHIPEWTIIWNTLP